MDIEDLIKHPEYRNFVCVYMGLAFAGERLEPYTRNGLQQVHQKIYTSLAGNPPCSQQCKAIDNSTRGWCDTCKKWRTMLTRYHAKKCADVDWTGHEPWKWSEDWKNIANIFVEVPETSVNLLDLSNACSIWTRCSEFKLEKVFLKNVKKCRNVFFAHNNTLRVSDIDKARVFDSLRDLLKDQEVQPFIDRTECLNELEKIEKSDTLITENIKHNGANSTLSAEGNKQVLENLIQTLHEVNKDTKHLKCSQNDLIKVIQSTNEIVILSYERQCKENTDTNSSQNYMKNILRDINVRTKKTNLLLHITFAIVICGIVFLAIDLKKPDSLRQRFDINGADMANRSRHIFTSSSCLSEQYSYPFEQDLPLLDYLPIQNELIGREWTLEILEQKLFTENTNSRGVLMTADYGFGKSAIVAHLLCVCENMKGWNIRKHIVAFHVCKFNVGLTKSPASLIRRLIGFLSMKSAEYGQYISLREHFLLLNENKCEKNLDACFDQAITIPLETLTPPDDAPWIIAIDALDECSEQDGTNRILELLSNRLIFVQLKGRKWLKWIVTSRQMSSLATLDKLDVVDFNSSDQRNLDDIQQLIINKLSPTHDYLHLAKSLAINSEGNMLYVTRALEYTIETENFSLPNFFKLPKSLDELYEINFDRLFKNNDDDFQTAKPILELLCIGQFKLSRIFEILTENKVVSRKHLEKVVDKLSFFVLTTDDIITFRHRSLHDWLKINQKYKVSTKRDHAMVSTYMLNSLTPDFHIDEASYICNLAGHVAKSGDDNLFYKFKSSNFTNFPNAKQLLNECGGVKSFIARISEISLKSLDLILNFIQKAIPGDIVNVISENIYFIAGDNLEIFKYLSEKVSHLEQSFLLHGAADHCKGEIARYLIAEANQSVFWEDMQGRRPSDIACSNGCLDVLKVIVEKDHSLMSMGCLYRALYSNKNVLYNIISTLELDLRCNRRNYTNFQKIYLEYLHFLEVRKYTEPIFDHLQAFFGNSILHILVYNHSEFTTQNTDSEMCTRKSQDFFMDVEVPCSHIAPPKRNKIWSLSESQIASTLSKPDHSLKHHDEYVRNLEIFKTFVNKYSKTLSCPDVQGFTPALLVVVLNKHDLLPEVLGQAVQDRCQKVSPVLLYIFWCMTQKYSCVLTEERWCWYRRKYSCPIQASFEHLLMRYERARMIDLVIVNGYTFDWNKRDIHGKTPLDYAKPDFIKQLENHYGVNIQVLSDKERLVQLCNLDWLYFVLGFFTYMKIVVFVGIRTYILFQCRESRDQK